MKLVGNTEKFIARTQPFREKIVISDDTWVFQYAPPSPTRQCLQYKNPEFEVKKISKAKV
jgi:hypothetical protein